MFVLCNVCLLLFKVSGNLTIVKLRTKGAQKVLPSLEKSVLSRVAPAVSTCPGGCARPSDLRILSTWLFAFTFPQKLLFMSFVSFPKDGQLHSFR